MLLKSNITGIKAGSDVWLQARRAKFTSSEMHRLCSAEGLGTTGEKYIREKVHEELFTGDVKADQFENDSMRRGLYYEEQGVNKFGLKMGWKWVVVQQMISVPGSRFASTPDALLVVSETETAYEVVNVELKCPDADYINLFMCKTPLDLKAHSRKYYFQTLDQSCEADTLKSYFVAYQPEFKAGNMHYIEFDYNGYYILGKDGKKTFPLFNDRKMLKERKIQAEQRFYDIRDQLLRSPKY